MPAAHRPKEKAMRRFAELSVLAVPGVSGHAQPGQSNPLR
jgi:hypothetical protein